MYLKLSILSNFCHATCWHLQLTLLHTAIKGNNSMVSQKGHYSVITEVPQLYDVWNGNALFEMFTKYLVLWIKWKKIAREKIK